jgi:hypothetical protein
MDTKSLIATVAKCRHISLLEARRLVALLRRIKSMVDGGLTYTEVAKIVEVPSPRWCAAIRCYVWSQYL